MLEKILINRINHHVFSQGFMNEIQFGFTPQKSTVDAAIAIKAFVQECLAAGEVITLVSLDVKGAFDLVNEQPTFGERNKQGIPAGVLLQPRLLEFPL